MTGAEKKSARAAGEDTVSGKVFWPIALLVLALVVTVFVMGFRWIVEDRDRSLTELNDRYVEKIEFRSGNRSERLLRIDGVTRWDCDEEDGTITCDDDPQPTEEQGKTTGR